MKAPRRRQKRDSATNIYRNCKQWGTCPDDVVNKVENNTIADRILKWASSFLYLGNLGIGTGSGTGGRTGYEPINTGVRVSSAGRPASTPIGGRTPAALPVQPFNPVDAAVEVGPSDSSIIPMVDLSTPSVRPAEVAPPAHTPAPTDSFIVTSDPGPAVLDVGPGAKGRVSRTQFHNPAYHAPSSTPAQVGESSLQPHQLIHSGEVQATPSGEAIELSTFSSTLNGDPPIASTPVRDVIRAQTAIRPFARGTQQVPVSDPIFLSRPQSLVTYDNPVFEAEDSFLFEHPSIHAAPDQAFMDIIALHRPALSTTRQGFVRVSRIGNRGTIRTRSGAQIGGRVHFFHDLSPIVPQESIEMDVLGGNASDPLGVADADEETLFDVFSDLDTPAQQETALADDDIIFRTPESTDQSFPFPAHMPAGLPQPVHIISKGGGVAIVAAPYTPAILSGGGSVSPITVSVSSDYWLHPSLVLRRKRKRKLGFYSSLHR